MTLPPTVDSFRTHTFCGRCNHPMHWRECGAGADLTGGPCRCRNDVSWYDPDPLTVEPFRSEHEAARQAWLNGEDDEPPVYRPRGCALVAMIAGLAVFSATVALIAIEWLG